MRRFMSLRGIGVEEGAATTVYLATAPEVEQISGQYFANQQPAQCSAAARDPKAAARLWQLSEVLTRSGATEIKADHAHSNPEGTQLNQ